MELKMIHKLLGCMIAGSIALAGTSILLIPGIALGTTDYMLKLPAYSKFKCAICHTSSKPVAGSAALNLFGIDFNANGKIWDRTLAIMNSDGDKCPNGFELNDFNGDGVPDDPAASEQSNPGEPDCTIAITKQTWGIIKEIFSAP